MPPRLTEIGARERPDHYHLPADAKCFYWGEYTPFEHTDGKLWNYSATNHLISNFKKKLDRRGHSDWPYKNQATQKIATEFSKFWKWQNLHDSYRVALIPVPPSKARDDPAYDGRMLDVLNGINARVSVELDIRDCFSFSGMYEASHETTARPTPDQLYAEIEFDDEVGRPDEQPGAIFLFDDMLTTGAHYVAVARAIAVHFPGVPVIGNFVARRIFPNPFADLSDLDDL